MTRKTLFALLLTGLVTHACDRGGSDETNKPTDGGDDPVSDQNPLFSPSPLQYQAPDYSAIQTEHFRPGFERGMTDHMAEIQAIAASEEKATFENTIVAMEKSGEIKKRTEDAFFNLTGTMSDPEIQAIEKEMAPKLSAHKDAILLDPKLFARIEKIYQARESLEPEQRRLAEKYYENFVRAGAKLDEASKTKVKEINAELSKLTTSFSQALLDATKNNAVVVEDKARLAGLSDAEIAGLAAAAEKAGRKGKYQINLLNTTRQPIISRLDDRELRKQVWEASSSRAAETNGAALLRIVELRAQKAKLLGYATWAHYVLEAQMAKTPDAVLSMLDDMAPQMVKKAKKEAAEIKKFMKGAKVKHDLEPWDWNYYAEKVRAKKFNIDQAQVKPYFHMDRVLEDGVFFAMNELFGVRFEERKDLPAYHPDVRTFEVFDDKGESIGLFYADYFAREGKRGGAWMNALVGQTKLLGRKPVILNCLNVPKPADGDPALLTFDEVQTMFHEMGHGVHGLFSNVTYPTLAGTSVPRDFVEFPSQFEEDWSVDPLVLPNYAKHYETGEPIPKELLDKVLAASKFNMGYDSLEYIQSALLDMEWHMLDSGGKPGTVQEFEAAALKRHGVLYGPVAPRYKSSYFSHVFAGGYSAGYYAYIWTEVLAADAFAYMGTQGGLKRENGDLFRDKILSRGNTIDPMQQYVNYRGSEPKVDALLKRRGLTN